MLLLVPSAYVTGQLFPVIEQTDHEVVKRLEHEHLVEHSEDHDERRDQASEVTEPVEEAVDGPRVVGHVQVHFVHYAELVQVVELDRPEASLGGSVEELFFFSM